MLPPNIPLRAGPSGPIVNLASYLENLDGLLQLRRIWTGILFEGETIPASSVPPGTAFITFDVVWSADEVALEAQQRLTYWGIWQAAAKAADQAAAYPDSLLSHLGWRPASNAPGVFNTLDTSPMPIVPLNAGEDYTFTARGGIQFIHYPEGSSLLELGTNQIAMCISNPGPTADAATVASAFTLIELVGQRSLTYFNHFPIVP